MQLGGDHPHKKVLCLQSVIQHVLFLMLCFIGIVDHLQNKEKEMYAKDLVKTKLKVNKREWVKCYAGKYPTPAVRVVHI
jgi:hypothetical protein